MYNDNSRKHRWCIVTGATSWASEEQSITGSPYRFNGGSVDTTGSGSGCTEMSRSAVSTSSQRSLWAQTPMAIETIIQHDCSEIAALVAAKHNFSYSSGPPGATRSCTRVPRRDMQARTKFHKRFISSEETKSLIGVRENIHFAWVSVSFGRSDSVSIQ